MLLRISKNKWIKKAALVVIDPKNPFFISKWKHRAKDLLTVSAVDKRRAHRVEV